MHAQWPDVTAKLRNTCRCPVPAERDDNLWRAIGVALTAAVIVWGAASPARADDEAHVITPHGFTTPGVAKTASGELTGRLTIKVHDRATGQPTSCRLNVVGPDGHFYQPASNPLTPYVSLVAMAEDRQRKSRGQRADPLSGAVFLQLGGGSGCRPRRDGARVEVWKGLEYQPVATDVSVAAGETKGMIDRTRTHRPDGCIWLLFRVMLISTSPARRTPTTRSFFDLLQAEDISFGSILAYNEPAGRYYRRDGVDEMRRSSAGLERIRSAGAVTRPGSPPARSIAAQRMDISIFTGATNCCSRAESQCEQLAALWPARSRDKATGRLRHSCPWRICAGRFTPTSFRGTSMPSSSSSSAYTGESSSTTGIASSISATVSPVVGASDYPACRKLGDCRTYVHLKRATELCCLAQRRGGGASFVTTGPLLLLEVDREPPGAIIRKSGTGPHQLHARFRTRSEVAPVQNMQADRRRQGCFRAGYPCRSDRGEWIELES